MSQNPVPSTSSAPTTVLGSLRFIGPGLILTAGIVGTGELILTPRVAAEHGFSLLWLILIGCVIKVFTQVELGRYSIARGVTTLQALDSLPGPRWRVSWFLWIWLPVFLAMISVIGGILGGTAELVRLSGLNWPTELLVALLGILCSALLGLGRYRLVEIGSTLMVAMFVVATLYAVIALQGTTYRVTPGQLLDGLSFHVPQNSAAAFATLGIIGVGAAELIYYPYWCLEKGYAHRVGPGSAADPGWLARAHGWLRVMRVDAWSSMVIYTLTTAAFYLLGAAILHAKGLVVTNAEMIPTLAHMYLETFGRFGLWVFILGGIAVLYSTAFAGSASNARLLADALTLFGALRPPADAAAQERRVRWCGALLPLYATVLYLLVPKPVTLILINGIGQALLLPFLAGAALYFRYRRLESPLRPGSAWTSCLWLSAAILTTAGGYQLWVELKKLLS